MSSSPKHSDDLRPKNIFILGLSSDIGQALADFYLRDGFHVYGTYRNIKSLKSFRDRGRLNLIPCDLARPEDISKAVEVFAGFNIPWDIFISTVGTTEPVGSFFACDFDAWEKSLGVNSSSQLKVLSLFYRAFVSPPSQFEFVRFLSQFLGKRVAVLLPRIINN